MPLATLSNINLFYAEKGQGEPLLFLNGISGDHGYWMGQLRAFGKQFHCLAIDNRDVGQSSQASHDYTIADMAADVAELLDQQHWAGAHVVGLSMGGMIAQELALARPDLVRSLVLANTLAHADDWFCRTLDAFAMIRSQVSDTAGFFEAILPWWVSHRFVEQTERVTWLLWLLKQNPYSQTLDGFLRQLGAIQGHDTVKRLSAIDCPVLILAGELDMVAPPRYSQQLQQLIPHASLTILEGVGHAPPIENAGSFNGCLKEFLGNLSGAPQRPMRMAV